VYCGAVRFGFAVLGAGTLVDGLYHAAPDAPFSQLLGPEGFNAHLIIFVGMVLVLVSVALQGLRTPRRTTRME
jgi:hypothetical protein